MARIFKDCLEMIQEMDRELKVSGITVPCETLSEPGARGKEPEHQGTDRGQLHYLQALP